MKRKTLKRTLAAVLSISTLALVQSAGFAAVRNDKKAELFADDFESYAVGSVSAELMPNWYMKDDLAACAVAEDGTNKVLKIANTTGAPVLAMAEKTTEKIEETPVTISFDVKVPETNSPVWGLVCPAMEETDNIDDTDFGQNRLVSIVKSENTDDTRIEIKYNDDTITPVSISTDTWYKVVIEENLGSSGYWSYRVSIYDEAGNTVGSDSRTGSPYMGSFQNINFTAWRTGAYYVDNVRIDKISRGLLASDDMEYSSKEAASKYWKITDSNCSFTEIDTEHGRSASVTGGEFTSCVAAEPAVSGIVNIEFDTYLSGTSGTTNNCGRFNVLPQGYTDAGSNTIINFTQRGGDGDTNVDLYVGDQWINQCPTGWYRVRVILDLDSSKYTVSVTDTAGNNYCSGNANTVDVTTRAVSSFAAVNFTTWSDPFVIDNVEMNIVDDPCIITKSDVNTISIEKSAAYTGDVFTVLVGVYSGDVLTDVQLVNSEDITGKTNVSINDVENRSIKVFVWNSAEGLEPIMDKSLF